METLDTSPTKKPALVMSERDKKITHWALIAFWGSIAIMVTLLGTQVISLIVYLVAFGCVVGLHIFVPPFFLRYDGVPPAPAVSSKDELVLASLKKKIIGKNAELQALCDERDEIERKAYETKLVGATVMTRRTFAASKLLSEHRSSTVYLGLMIAIIAIIYVGAYAFGFK